MLPSDGVHEPQRVFWLVTQRTEAGLAMGGRPVLVCTEYEDPTADLVIAEAHRMEHARPVDAVGGDQDVALSATLGATRFDVATAWRDTDGDLRGLACQFTHRAA